MFKKVFLSVLVLAFVFMVKAQPTADDLIQPSKSIQVHTDDFHSAVDTIRSADGTWTLCKGLMLRAGVTTTSPVVEINLYGDPTTTWVPYPLTVGVPAGVIFRLIRSTNTTAPLDSIIVFPRN